MRRRSSHRRQMRQQLADELKERNRQVVIDDSFLSWILVLSMRRCTTSFTGKTGTNINKNA